VSRLLPVSLEALATVSGGRDEITPQDRLCAQRIQESLRRVRRTAKGSYAPPPPDDAWHRQVVATVDACNASPLVQRIRAADAVVRSQPP